MLSLALPPACLQAVHFRHHYIKDNEVRQLLVDKLERLPAVLGHSHFIAVFFDKIAKYFQALPIVVNNQDQ